MTDDQNLGDLEASKSELQQVLTARRFTISKSIKKIIRVLELLRWPVRLENGYMPAACTANTV